MLWKLTWLLEFSQNEDLLFNRLLARRIFEIYDIFNFKKVPKLDTFLVKHTLINEILANQDID